MATLTEAHIQALTDSIDALTARKDAGFKTVTERLDCVEGQLHDVRNHKYSNIMTSLSKLHREVAELKKNA